MGRSREFDRDRALVAAVEVFWRNGYGSTSVQELVRAMGIHRASLYEAFGSKEQLFADVVRRYSDLVLESWFAPLGEAPGPDSSSPVLAGLRGVLEEVSRLFQDSAHPWCLVERALVTHGRTLGRARAACLDHRRRVGTRFDEVLRAGRGTGEVRDDVPLPDLVRVLQGAITAMGFRKSLGDDDGTLRAIREGALRALAR